MNQTIAVYLRVSTNSQDVASQEPELRRWAAQQEGEVRWYRDRFTGKTIERPAFTRLLRHVRVGEVQQVVVWRLDRLGRTAKGLTALFDELTELNVRLVSLRDGLDLTTAAGRLMANVLASVAAYETEVRAERILAGQAAARAKGKKWGGSEKGRRIKVNDEQIRLIHRMKAEGEKVAAIARATGLSRPTIYDVLKTEPALQKN
ncbi:recombinase family protein [Rubripirellula sp.]|nr:recombinase family protein [Rubripirellula sp.]